MLNFGFNESNGFFFGDEDRWWSFTEQWSSRWLSASHLSKWDWSEGYYWHSKICFWPWNRQKEWLKTNSKTNVINVKKSTSQLIKNNIAAPPALGVLFRNSYVILRLIPSIVISAHISASEAKAFQARLYYS